MNQTQLTELATLRHHGFSTTASGPDLTGVYIGRNAAIAKDLIFGLSVWNGDEFYPLKDCTYAELVQVRDAINNDPAFPYGEEFAALVKAAIEREASAS